MRDASRETLTIGLSMMAEVLRNAPDFSKETQRGESLVVDIYAAALGDPSPTEIEGAVRLLLQEPGRIFFPTPGELIAALISHRRAQRAIQEGKLAETRALRPAPEKPPAAIIEELTRLKSLGEMPHPGVEERRPLSEPATPSEQARLNDRVRAALRDLEDWQRKIRLLKG